MHKVRRELEGPAVDADELREQDREVGGHELVQEQVSRDLAAALGAGSHSGHRTGSAGSVPADHPGQRPRHHEEAWWRHLFRRTAPGQDGRRFVDSEGGPTQQVQVRDQDRR